MPNCTKYKRKLTNKPSVVNIVLIANLKVTKLSSVNHSLTAHNTIHYPSNPSEMLNTRTMHQPITKRFHLYE